MEAAVGLVGFGECLRPSGEGEGAIVGRAMLMLQTCVFRLLSMYNPLGKLWIATKAP